MLISCDISINLLFLYMKSILEYIDRNTFENRLGEIRFELDEESCKYFQISESNRTIYSDKESTLKIGDHATQREDRPTEKGGDGEHIDESEIINMFRWAWDDIIDMYQNGLFKPDGDIKRFTIQLKCYLKEKPNKKLEYDGARPEDKYLWAVFMPVENYQTGKIDIIIVTIFRGVRINHVRRQERIVIATNGYVKQMIPR